MCSLAGVVLVALVNVQTFLFQEVLAQVVPQYPRIPSVEQLNTHSTSRPHLDSTLCPSFRGHPLQHEATDDPTRPEEEIERGRNVPHPLAGRNRVVG